MRRLTLIFLLTAALAAAPAWAQTRAGVDLAPPSTLAVSVPPTAELRSLDEIPRYEVPPIDLAVVELEDYRLIARGLPARYAAPHRVRITPLSYGLWERVDGGRWLWRLRVASPGALSLNLAFTSFRLPRGARFYVYSPDGEHQIGPFTRDDNDVHGQLWTPPLTADELVLELVVPAASRDRVALELGSINHGYAGFGEPRAKSGACNVDVGCQIAASWAREARAVGLISVGGVYFCSGFLVNNTAQDGRPLFMTAGHCGITADNAASVVVLWDHAFDGCRARSGRPQAAAHVCAQEDDRRRFQTGAVWRAEDPVTDVTLVELDDRPAPEHGVYYVGWDHGDDEPRRGIVIHHPNTDAKRISFDVDPATTTSHLADSGPGDASHLRVGGWELGTTEGGSSGAPLFNQERRVVGVLHGGHAACGNREPDWFGRLAAAWDASSRPDGRLRDWLDPLDTGVLFLDGFDPLAAAPEPGIVAP